jgi:hypothetical protein
MLHFITILHFEFYALYVIFSVIDIAIIAIVVGIVMGNYKLIPLSFCSGSKESGQMQG